MEGGGDVVNAKSFMPCHEIRLWIYNAEQQMCGDAVKCSGIIYEERIKTCAHFKFSPVIGWSNAAAQWVPSIL